MFWVQSFFKLWLLRQFKKGLVLGDKDGSVQGGKRPVIVLQNNTVNQYSPATKAIPHKDCRADAQSAFSSGCPKRRRNTGVYQGGKNGGKDASVCAVLP